VAYIRIEQNRIEWQLGYGPSPGPMHLGLKVAHIAIYSRGMRHHAVGTSHINPIVRQHTFTIKFSGKYTYTRYLMLCLIIR